ncbi:conjugal transfer protein TraX [Paenibacillus sp. 1011MAR3C5]|uniref:TraX family protein n=1 Tax=Paenibacillus sp. 1011MAR3C5 TaxID=1675787 RepID=UPI000E6C1D42|nr:TraX family protein [Paenibacillus sp. 1011MAR3C5]RJE84291.1 conjugal transfer protein TraX [Paenibacillus sp. 1011MAR3C5]
MIRIQFLAMLTMLIDHIGVVWHPDDTAWRIIGRLALPFYVYAMVTGYSRTRDVTRYLTRVGLLAIISQLPYHLAFRTHGLEINVIATLFFCLLTMLLLDLLKGKMMASVLTTAAIIVLLEALPFDYGGYALLLMLIYRYATPHMMVLLHLAINVFSIFYKGWTLQLFSLLSTLWIVYMPDLMRSMDRIRMPRFLWRSFYPLHLLIIAIISYTINP